MCVWSVRGAGDSNVCTGPLACGQSDTACSSVGMPVIHRYDKGGEEEEYVMWFQVRERDHALPFHPCVDHALVRPSPHAHRDATRASTLKLPS